MSAPRRFSLRRRLTALALVLAGVSTLICSLLYYRSAKQTLEDHLGHELLAIVNSTAPLVDGDLVPFIGMGADGAIQGREEFDELRTLLRRVAEGNALASKGSPIYIMRAAADDAGQMEFVAMPTPDEKGRWFVGNRVKKQPHNGRALRGFPASSGVYEDGEGLWISASAPVRDSTGKVVAIVQADRPVNYFYQKARGEAAAIAGAAFASLLLAAALASMLARNLTRPVHDLVDATKRLAGGELDCPVDLKRNDELGDLGESINQMARQLEAARAALLERQKQLAQALEEAREASQAKGEFLANMSHELRTPLNAIIGYTEMLREVSTEQGWITVTGDLDRIHMSAKHLLELITTVLDYSKLEAGKLEVAPRPYAIDRIIGEVMSTVTPLARRGRNEFMVQNYLPGESAMVDPLRFRQSLLNLISNACKFTENGQVSLKVARRERDGKNWIAWSVSDTGLGIRQEDQSRLFQAFSQVDASSTRRYEGSGLGLALSAQLCQLMQGHITVESELGKGSTFTIWMPDVER